ncbi:MAG: NCS2 family permease, partial [Verrucomicrobia bacterium]|nr:NCS2 family permease [Verrucomicrobiota bacterium]
MLHWIEKKFQLTARNSSIRQELVGGLTTFATMAYIIVVNPLMLEEAGLNFSSVMFATILTAAFATLCMAWIANYPFALAPGVGMAAYFTYSVCLGQNVPWQTALGIVFFAGIALFVLWAFRLRELIIAAIPKALQLGTTAGLGLFLVLIGLKNGKVIVAHPKTLMALGNLSSPETILSLLGVLVISVLMALRVQGAILIGILLNWILGLILGLSTWKGLISWPNFSTDTFGAFNYRAVFESGTWMIMLSFVFISLFDTAGSLLGLSHQGHFLDKQGNLPRLRRALLPDALGTIVGSLSGTSSTAVYVESAAGIASGARTGLSMVFVSLCFFACLFFGPLASSIPLFSITPVLIVIGALMLRACVYFDWEDPTEFIPAFMTLIAIPFTFSIGTGIGIGMIFYPLCKAFTG